MTAEERRLRQDLEVLAATEQGRRLLQLGLRGIERGERQLTAGCWVRRGNAGCLFQHAYWEGVREGIFADKGRPGDWIGSFVGPHDYGIVIRAIESFDRLARSRYADVKSRPVLPDTVQVRHDEWNVAVERLLVQTLGSTGPEPNVKSGEIVASL
jgi:hypothetical protein